MTIQDSDTIEIFEAALRALGEPRLRLNQVVGAFHAAFPSEAMRPDMRQRLHNQLFALMEAGVLQFADEDPAASDDPLALPSAVELAALPELNACAIN